MASFAAYTNESGGAAPVGGERLCISAKKESLYIIVFVYSSKKMKAT
jgi:hypothetical protein